MALPELGGQGPHSQATARSFSSYQRMSHGCLVHERRLGRSEFPSIEHVKEPKGKQAEGGEQHANIGVAHPPLLFRSCFEPSGRVRDFEEPERNTIKLISDADFAPEFVETVVGPFQFSNRDDKFSTSKQGDRWADAAPSYINRLRAWQVSHQSWHTRTPSRSCLPKRAEGYDVKFRAGSEVAALRVKDGRLRGVQTQSGNRTNGRQAEATNTMVFCTPMNGFVRFAGTLEFSGVNHEIRRPRLEQLTNGKPSGKQSLSPHHSERMIGLCMVLK
jgi:hypothetical protein